MKKPLLWILTLVLAAVFSYIMIQYEKSEMTNTYVSNPIVIDTFDQRHADAMDKKDEKVSLLSGEISPTLSLLQPSQEQDIVTEEVAYMEGVRGFLAYPEANPTAPGIVVIHEWRGLNEHIKDMARVLAMNGYRALAVDLYNGQVASDATEARELSSSLVQEVATANLLAAETYLREQSEQVASLGWCLGGAQSLQLSLASDTLDATVIYYGRLTDDVATLQNINTPLLGIFAENDGGIPPSDVVAFQSGLGLAGITDYDITIYPGVDHAFANPTGGNYAQEATIDAWQKTLEFLATTMM